MKKTEWKKMKFERKFMTMNAASDCYTLDKNTAKEILHGYFNGYVVVLKNGPQGCEENVILTIPYFDGFIEKDIVEMCDNYADIIFDSLDLFTMENVFYTILSKPF